MALPRAQDLLSLVDIDCEKFSDDGADVAMKVGFFKMSWRATKGWNKIQALLASCLASGWSYSAIVEPL